MTALATLDDLKHNGIEVTDEQTATSLLDSVSEAVRSAAGCPITLGEWTVDIPRNREDHPDAVAARELMTAMLDVVDSEDLPDVVELGFAIAPLGPNQLGVRSVPALLQSGDPAALARSLIGELREQAAVLNPEFNLFIHLLSQEELEPYLAALRARGRGWSPRRY